MAQPAPASSYSCHCLNVRILAQPASGSPPTQPKDDYRPIFVGDEGISTTINEVTLRTRGPLLQPDAPRPERYMLLTCLLCQKPVYRVLQDVNPDAVEEEGPVVPTEDWVEHEPLKSSNGWIEVHDQCLSGDTVQALESSSSYSSIFRLALPAPAPERTPRPSSPLPSYLSFSPSQFSPISTSPATPRAHLPTLRPLLPPPPFTPSHPVFVRLATAATAESQRLRTAAEEELAAAARAHAERIVTAEDALRAQVEALWRSFRDGARTLRDTEDTASGDGSRPRTSSRRRESASWGPAVGGAAAAAQAAAQAGGKPQSVRDFVPVRSPPGSRERSAAASPRPAATSALSASLVSSGMHYPRAQQQQPQHHQDQHHEQHLHVHPHPQAQAQASSSTSSESPPPARSLSIPQQSPPPYASNPSSWSSPRSRSSASASIATRRGSAGGEAASIREAYRRNMDQVKDIATSFRYEVDLKEEIRRAEEARGRAKEVKGRGMAAVEEEDEGKSNGKGEDKGKGREVEVNGTTEPKGKGKETVKEAAKEASLSPARKESQSKGKRKVTFDVQPDVVTIKRELKAEALEEEEQAKLNPDAIVFDFEDETGLPGDPALLTESDKPILQLKESPAAHVRPSRPRKAPTTGIGLPSSLSALRPSSLPAPSTLRPTHPPAPVPLPAAPKPKPARAGADTPADGAVSPDPREAEIRRLVAADVPSHRGAWKRDSRAWQLFVKRKGGKAVYPTGGAIAEVDDEDDGEDEGEEWEEEITEEVEEGGSGEHPDVNGSQHDRSPGLAHSLPISIGPLSLHPRTAPGVALPLPSYHPKTSLTDKPGLVVPALRTAGLPSSAAIRKAAYAERDRSRSLDPGALDFTAEEDEDAGEDAGEDENDDEYGEGHERAKEGLGRQRARQILLARRELPDSGMWRSLAS